MNLYLGIDIGGTAIKYAIMNENAELFEKSEYPTPKDNLDEFYAILDKIVLPRKDKLQGIAISMPGRIDNSSGYVYTAGALSSYLKQLPLKELLEKRYSLHVAIENDGKCAALAELWLGNLKDVSSGAVIILGTGIGGGIILDGKPWRGIHGSAGEFSIISTSFDSHEFNAHWASSNGVYGLLAPYAMTKQVDIQTVNGKIFFEALNNHDEDAKKIFEHYIKTLISGLISIQSILDIERFCIGGGISAQDILIDSIREALDDYFIAGKGLLPLIKPEIERCAFRNDANLIGALKNFFIQIYE